VRLRRVRRHEQGSHRAERPQEASGAEPDFVQIDPEQLTGVSAVFAAPRWLRIVGVASWLLVGLTLLVGGLVALLALTSEIVQPVVAGAVVATVAVPIVTWLQQHRVPRALGALLVLVGLVGIAGAIVVLVVGGIVSQGDTISQYANEAADKLQAWLKDLGVSDSGASTTKESIEKAVPEIISTLVTGIVTGIKGIASLAFGLSFATLAVFFLLKDGPSMRGWVDRHLGPPLPVAQTITGEVIRSLRRYFAGVTIVAAFNAVVVGLAAFALGVPLAGTIAVVTFVTAYIPYIGAAVAGFFTVVVALGAEGTTTALIMLVVVILANGMLQQVVQPIAFGATLDLNPLVVLVVTVGAGCLFGMIGLILAAPLVSAAVHISADLARARAGAPSPEAQVDPAPPETGSAPTPAPS
jgi:predicted PurR-regulated permease PerM